MDLPYKEDHPNHRVDIEDKVADEVLLSPEAIQLSEDDDYLLYDVVDEE